MVLDFEVIDTKNDQICLFFYFLRNKPLRNRPWHHAELYSADFGSCLVFLGPKLAIYRTIVSFLSRYVRGSGVRTSLFEPIWENVDFLRHKTLRNRPWPHPQLCFVDFGLYLLVLGPKLTIFITILRYSHVRGSGVRSKVP